MIVILGPDHSGKTVLAKELSALGYPYYHFDKDSSYLDYLKPLCELKLFDAVLDRCPVCEYPYSGVMNRKFKFTMKEWHNLILLMLIQNPLIVLCTHKPPEYSYPKEQYLPYEEWDRCLNLYKEFLSSHHINFLEYDYTSAITAGSLAVLERRYREKVSWWKPMWESKYGCIGSPNPKVLLVAERIGPNNMNNLPFETGPTGLMLSDMLYQTGTPLNKFTVTNMVKSFRRDTRLPNESDEELLRTELNNLKPEKAVFMGSVAKNYGARVAKDLGVEVVGMTHFGYYSHKRITDLSPLYAQWRTIMGIMPKLTSKEY